MNTRQYTCQSPPPQPIDDSRCPLCGEVNACGVHAATPCWCMTMQMPQGLLDRLPAAARGCACICRQCVETAQAALNVQKQKP